MEYRHSIDNSSELAKWYSEKYKEMKGGWVTPPEESNKHLDDLGVPFDSKLRLLDIGCGAGHFLLEASKRVMATGIEMSREGVRLSDRMAPEANIYEMSAEKMTFQDDHFDFVTSIGSLEHVVDLDAALLEIKRVLKPSGKFYFYCPNENWTYDDQPNERTMTDGEWELIFNAAGLKVLQARRWGEKEDNTAFIGRRSDSQQLIQLVDYAKTKLLNIGSGQRPFDRDKGWINVDIQEKWGPDLVADMVHLPMFKDNSIDMIVNHHGVEHLGCGEAVPFFKEAFRLLRPGGGLLIFVPDLRTLAQRWLLREIDDYTFFVNIYGAYNGDEADRHKWAFTFDSMAKDLFLAGPWSTIKYFDWRQIEGASIAKDFWILGMEAIR